MRQWQRQQQHEAIDDNKLVAVLSLTVACFRLLLLLLLLLWLLFIVFVGIVVVVVLFRPSAAVRMRCTAAPYMLQLPPTWS